MDEMEDHGDVSLEDSDDMLWETVKVDLELNRANQEEQLQTLKGKLLRVPPSKEKVKKHIKKHRNPLKKMLKKKAFLKALDTIKSLACKIKARRKCSPKNNGNISTMNFKVCCNPDESDTENNNFDDSAHIDELSQEDDINKDSHHSVRDQIVQTEELIVEDKLCQTNLLEKTPTSTGRNFGDIVSPQIPFYVAPLPYGLCMHSFAGSTCCGNSRTHKCSVATDKTGQCQHTNLVHEGVQTDDNQRTDSQYSLKQICEQLFVQLCEKINVSSNGTSHEKSDFQGKERCALDNSPKTPDVSSGHTRKIFDALHNLHPDMKVLTVNHMASPNMASPRILTTLCQSSEAVSAKAATFPEMVSKTTTALEMEPCSSKSPEVISPSVTPDLLRNNMNCPNSNINDISVEGSADMFDDDQVMQSPNDSSSRMLEGHSSQRPKNQTSKTISTSYLDKQVDASKASEAQNQLDLVGGMNKMESVAQCSQADKPKGSLFKIGKNHGSRTATSGTAMSENIKEASVDNITSNATQTGSLSTGASERVLSHVMKTSAIASASNSSNNLATTEVMEVPVISAGSNTDDSRSKVSKTLFPETGDSSDSSLIDVVTPVVTKPGTEEGHSLTSTINLNGNGNSAFRPITNNKGMSSESNKSVCNIAPVSVDEHGNSQLRGANMKGGKDKTDKELKVLSRVQNSDICNISRKRAVNSPAFEEMDATEMESVLLVWRQQELLHQETEKTPPSVFKKIKRPRELPSELRSLKILRPPPPPPPPTKNINTSLSALDILDNEAKKPVEQDEDDDVSEHSPKSIVQPSKRRKLKLRLNSPSALPLVFEKCKESAEDQSRFEPTGTSTEEAAISALPQSERGITKDGEGNENFSKSELPIALRLSRRVKGAKQKSDSMPSEKKSDAKVKEVKNAPKKSTGKDDTTRSQSKKTDESNDCPNGSEVVTIDQQSPSNLKISDSEAVKDTNNCSGKKAQYKDQIKERNDKLKQQWLLERSGDEDDVFVRPLPIASSPSSQSTDCDQGIMASLEKIPSLKDVQAIDVGKAHDLVISIILNPWRGINAKPVTRGFACPDYDSRPVSRALWDLRSNAIPDKVVESIMSLGWKDVHPHGFKALVSLFTLSLARDVSFVIEANSEEDDTVSLCSDSEHTSKKKPTPLRLVATKQIFKGECIEGLNGLLLKVPTQDKDKLRSWIFRKFEQHRDWAIFGPLAYLKRKETCANTMAVILQGEVIAVKATRQILRGERLFVSFKALERTLLQ